MTGTVLHPGLRGWSAALAALSADVATGLAPLVRRLDELVGRHGETSRSGEVDGFAGLTTRGRPDRLLLSQWALADEVPDEFLRRAVNGELMHLETARRSDPPTGTTRVVVDTGPSQAGAARLVQLAAIVVLHRRAADRGADLEIGVLGEDAEEWHGGDLPELLRVWLRARRSSEPTVDEVLARTGERVWYLLAPRLRSALPSAFGGGRVLTAAESDWDGRGAMAVEVRLAGEVVHLPLPEPSVAVRALRGEGFRATRVRNTTEPTLEGARLSGAGLGLVARGESPGDLHVTEVGAGHRSVVHRWTFRGVVLAALAMGRRTVVLHQHDGGVEVSVVGRRLGRWQGVVVPLEVIGVPRGELEAVPSTPPAPLHFAGGDLWVRLRDTWHVLDAEGGVVPSPAVVDVVPRAADVVAFVHRLPDVLVGPWGRLDGVPLDAPVLWGGGWSAARLDAERWVLHGGRTRHVVTTGAQDTVLGVVHVHGGPRLVTRSAAGLLLRLVGPDGTATPGHLGDARPRRVAVHPVRPLVALDAGTGTIEVHDVQSGTRVGRVAGTLA